MASEPERELVRRRALGVGLACPEVAPGADRGRDLVLARGPNGLDFARVAGLANLSQALQMALTTLLGADVFNTGYGFDGLAALADEVNPVLLRERVRIGIIQVLRKDPRVRQVIDVKFDGGQLDPPLPGSRELRVRVSFEAISFDQASVEL